MNKGGVGVLGVGCCPVEWRRDRTGSGDSVNKRAGHKSGRGIGGVDGCEKVDINQVVHKMGAEAKGATSREGNGKIDESGGCRDSGKDHGGSRIAREELGNGKGSDVVGAEGGCER